MINYRLMTKQEKKAFDSNFKLLFSGDLLLFEDSIKYAYNGKEYDFSYVFEYTKKYISDADLAVGVFEGPCAGEGKKNPYTIGNYRDGIQHWFNFPDSYAKAVKEAGFDVVTTANNHLLDKFSAGALRTIDVLDSVGLAHTGSYRSKKEKETPLIIERDGIKFAFIGYTYGTNRKSSIEIKNSKKPFITSCLVSPNHEFFEEYKNQVFEDFKRIKKEKPDIIIVLPHMGSFLTHELNEYQLIWSDIFIEAGADVILCDHSHAVHPIEFKGDVLLIHGVGNYTNSFIKYNGDASALAEVYFDRNTKKIKGVSIIPLYANAQLDKPYRALPIFDVLNSKILRSQIGVYEFNRIKEVQKIVTKVMLGRQINYHLAAERYYITKESVLLDVVKPCELDAFEESAFIKLLRSKKSVCFAGDSITAGSKNGGIGWFEPIMAHFESIISYNVSWNDATVQTLIRNSDKLIQTMASLYVIAIGVNDVRYRNKHNKHMSLCAMTSKEYTDKIYHLVNTILNKNTDAEFVFIAPWIAFPGDGNNKCKSEAERDSLLDDYRMTLEKFCLEKGYLYINPANYLLNVFRFEPRIKYLADHIHPNRLNGIQLYSKAVVLASVNKSN